MAGLWYWLKPKAVVEQVPVQVVTPAVQSTPAPVVATPTPAVTVPDQITASTRQEKPQLITPQDAFRSDPVRISELPLNVQRQIPDMVFSSHLYADEADFRMVNINGRMYRENEMVSDGVKLIEITEQGVVLTYLHYTFEVSVLQDWSFN